MLVARLTPVEQHGAVVGLQELAQRLDPLDDQRQVVLPAQREHRIDQIVPRPLLAQVHLQPVGEEGEQIDDQSRVISSTQLRDRPPSS